MKDMGLKAVLALAVMLSLSWLVPGHAVSSAQQPAAEHQGGTSAIGHADVLAQVQFKHGGAIRYTQDKTLKLWQSRGWTWAFFPNAIDLNRYPRLTIHFRTTEPCTVYFELKDKQGQAERALVGKVQNNNVWKLRLQFPNTGGDDQEVVIDLREHFRPEVTDRLAKVIVFSDPESHIDIRSLTFEEQQ